MESLSEESLEKEPIKGTFQNNCFQFVKIATEGNTGE